MRVRTIAALALGLVLALTGCSGGKGRLSPATGADGGGAESSAPGLFGPKYTPFAEFPGEELLYVSIGEPIGLRLKAVDEAWQVELADRTARVGRHYLVVYVAVTGEAADRGVSRAYLNFQDIRLRFSGTEPCEQQHKDTDGQCYYGPDAPTAVQPVADGEWRTAMWNPSSSTRPDIPAGGTMIGALGFALPDTVQLPAALTLCAMGRDVSVQDNCIPVPLPTEPRPV